MLNVELDRNAGLAVVKPEGILTEGDFDAVARVIDPYLEEHGELRGLLIHTRDFPGWDSLGTMLQHFRFVRDHHRRLSHVALVTDSRIGGIAEKMAGHFVSAKVRHFPYDQLAEAKGWIMDDARSGQST